MAKKYLSSDANMNLGILVVEDSDTQAQQLQLILEEEEFKVQRVENGKMALEFLETNLPSIIISDVLMPELDGFQLCSRIKADKRLASIPVILLTSLADPHDIIKGLESGAENFITKPYNKEYLLSRISYILTNQKLRRVSGEKNSEMGLEIFFGGKKYFITSQKMQIIDLLFSTFEAVVQKNIELEHLNKKLTEAHENIRVLKGFIPICSHCKKVRNDDGFWEQVEVYICEHSEADFSHSLCPDCITELYPNFKRKNPGD
ncbi:MAG: response regulator [bacterium]|nr:response regulator [bacterium]